MKSGDCFLVEVTKGANFQGIQVVKPRSFARVMKW